MLSWLILEAMKYNFYNVYVYVTHIAQTNIVFFIPEKNKVLRYMMYCVGRAKLGSQYSSVLKYTCLSVDEPNKIPTKPNIEY